MNRYRGIHIGVVALILVAVGVVLTVCCIVGRSLPFEEGEWKAGDRRVRWRMAHDPKLAPSLIGLTEDALRQKLGNPDNLLVVRHSPLDKVYFYCIDAPLDPCRWNLKLCIEQGVVSEVFIVD